MPPNITGNGPLVHIAHTGDSVCYDKGLNGGVSIIRRDSYNLDLFNVTGAKVELPKERPFELDLSIAEKIAWTKKEIEKLENAGINTYEDTVRIAMFIGYLKCLETKGD